MTSFKKLIKNKVLQKKESIDQGTAETEAVGDGDIYDIEFKYARLFVKGRKLLDQNTVPVGLPAVLYNNLLRCRLRHTEVLKTICKRNIFRNLKYKCGRALSRMVLLCLAAVPWVLRLWVYFTFEEDTVLQKRELAGRFGLKTIYTSSFTLSLAPFHALFLVIYTILIVDCLVYSCIAKAMKKQFRFVLGKSLRGMKEQFGMGEKVTKFLLEPCETLPRVGVLVCLWRLCLLVACLPVLAIFIFPALNLTARLLAHFVFFMCPSKVRFAQCEKI